MTKLKKAHRTQYHRTFTPLALVPLFTGLGLTAFDDVVTMTAGTEHGQECHETLLLKKTSAWHT